jgi:hypothetical protein
MPPPTSVRRKKLQGFCAVVVLYFQEGLDAYYQLAFTMVFFEKFPATDTGK